MKLTRNLQTSHVFRASRSFKLTKALQTLHTWNVVHPSLILKQWITSLTLTHVTRRPFRSLGYLQKLELNYAFHRPTRIIKLPAHLQVRHFGDVPFHFLRFIERLGLAHMVYVAVPGAKRTKLFLVVGDLAIQITGD